MKITSYYPVIMTHDVYATADFYTAHFGFEEKFRSDWYIHLRSTADASVHLAVLNGSHETIPESGRGRVSGLLLNFEVEDSRSRQRSTSEDQRRQRSAVSTR